MMADNAVHLLIINSLKLAKALGKRVFSVRKIR